MTITEEFLKPRGENDIPYLFAKKLMPTPLTYNLYEKNWEGLRKVNRKGKIIFEIDEHQTVEIDGATGECRIPDTENNRKRLEKLCTTRKTKGTHRVLDQDKGTYSDEPTIITVPPAFKRLDESLVEKQTLDVMEAKLLDRLRNKFDITPKQEEDKDPPMFTEDDHPKVGIEKLHDEQGKLLDPIK